MIRSAMCLVLGAGASKPIGFPTGPELLQILVSDLGRTRGQIRQLALEAGFDSTLVDAFTATLREAVLPSVDLLLENRPEFKGIGKYCIAAALLSYEKHGLFAPDRAGPQWLRYLFAEMASDASPDTFADNRVSFVSYNYDRCLEHFFFTALRSTYGLSDEDCAEIVRKIPICHVHGQLGAYPGLGDSAREFAATATAPGIMQCAAQIRILHEGADDDPHVERARDLCRAATGVGFVGFGYHPTNIRRLRSSQWPTSVTTFGSAFGLTAEEMRRAQQVIGRGVEFGATDQDALAFLRSSRLLRLCTR